MVEHGIGRMMQCRSFRVLESFVIRARAAVLVHLEGVY
jgi:hypothetical protein